MGERFSGAVRKAIQVARLSLIGVALSGCAEGVQQDVSPTPTTPTPVTREFTPTPFRDFPSRPTATEFARPDSTRIVQPTNTADPRPTVSTPVATAPVSEAPKPVENWAARFDGEGDAIVVASDGILLSGPFRIEAKVKVEGNPGGDTIVSKGDGLAIFARSLRCVDRLGVLIDGKDLCTNVRLGLETFNHIVVTYDNQEMVVMVNDQEALRRELTGPLQISSADLMIGRRPGVSRQPFSGYIDDFRVYENGELRAFLDFNTGFIDLSSQKREVKILGDPKREAIR